MAFSKSLQSWRCLRPSDRPLPNGDRVREISRPRRDAGAQAETDVFVATACPAVTAAANPAATVTEILARDIASQAET
jgi:hypothetical protein